MTKSLDYKKVLVGVSGGVDSSVCIDLLKKQGLEVEGVVIRFSPESDDAVKDAQRVCEKLGITLHVADAQADFHKWVVTPFCENYVSGRTPNPCIVCNPHVKFATLIKTADELGIGYIATGHYAQVEKVGDTFYVKKAISTAKDQSYMLYRLPQEILSRLLLP
ncbi:MAG: 7-cyano-7-deazaguanine synthase, partial [Oscillospiraceae bacterium]|nr:7-cyano-7-deazaguanine synthase [Oscillospiraceae bacterium]